MLEIKTLTETYPHIFDRAVNEALSEGWELTRRECFITGADRATTFYAELERVTEETSEEEDRDDTARWVLTRNPRYPYRCGACGYTTNAKWPTCPDCDRVMVETAE